MLFSHLSRSFFKCAFIPKLLLAALVTTFAWQSAAADVTCIANKDHQITPYLGTWQGQLGDTTIEFYLEPHAQDPQRTQGHYIQLVNPQKQILIVGEQIKGIFEIEESANGSDISGLWELTFPTRAPQMSDCYRTLQGEWLDQNFKNSQSITLEREPLSW